MAPQYFDRYVIVDWSAAASPKTGRDSIWIANLSEHTVIPWQPVVTNPPTRLEAKSALEEILIQNHGERILVGFDFPLGLPAGTAQALGGIRHAIVWRHIWNELSQGIVEGAKNKNNRFDVASRLNQRMGASAGPFWACPSSAQNERLLPTRPEFPVACAAGPKLQEYRIAENILRGQKKKPQSVWKLYTQASVGSQTLTGLPILSSLRSHPQLQDRIRVWPFETQFGLPTFRNAIVFAEVWPTIVQTDLAVHPIRDAAQVITYAAYVLGLDRQGELQERFGPPRNVSAGDIETAVREEGWILGVEG